MNQFILFFILVLSFIGCSKSSKAPVKISFSVSTQALSGVDGGLVVYGKNSTTNDRFMRILSATTESINEDLTLGTWEIGAMGWAGGVKGPFTGKVVCAANAPTSVTSGPVVFELSLDNSTCFTSAISEEVGDFIGGDPDRRFAPLTVDFCDGDISTIPSGNGCNYGISMPMNENKKSFIGSYRFELIGVQNYKGVETPLLNETISTSCFIPMQSQSLDATVNTNDINFPKMALGRSLPLRIVTYMDDSCMGTKGAVAVSVNELDKSRVDLLNSIEKKILVRLDNAKICIISNLLGVKTSFASGSGSQSNPHLICNTDQFYLLQREYSSHKTKSFVLGTDIDLISGISAGSINANPFHNCLESGDTFLPIGYSVDSGTCAFTSPAPGDEFSGQLDGAGKTIKNFRFKSHTSSKIALISAINNAKLANLNLDKFEIEGGVETGALVGTVSGASALIRNIKVKGLDLRVSAQSGGVIGDLGQGVVEDIHVSEARILANGNEVGGIVGVSSVGLNRISFDGVIDIEHFGGTLPNYFGGIVGALYGAGNISKAVTAGVISGQFSKVGGIAGSFGTGTLSFARSEMLIHDRNPHSTEARYFGGLVGYSSGSTVSRSFNMGTIQSPCSTGSCYIGPIAGSTLTVENSLAPTSTTLGGISTTPVAGANDFYYTAATTLCSGINPCDWSQPAVSSDIPRLDFENHLCENAINNDSITAQKTAGKGTALNPIIICRPSQMELIVTQATASDHIKLGHHINLDQYSGTPGILSSSSFLSASFDGNNKIIHSFSPTVSNGGILGEIAVSSIVRNIELRGIKMNIPSCATCSLAPLSKKNYGTIHNIRVFDSSISTTSSDSIIGGVVAENMATGKINNARVDIHLEAPGQMGGVVYQNAGEIELVESRARITISGSGSKVGGVVGFLNKGKIKRAEFSGEINIIGSPSMIGGIVGSAERGTITSGEIVDSVVSSYGKIQLPNSGGMFTAGIIGGVSGSGVNLSIKKTIFNGNLIVPKANSGTSFAGIFPVGSSGIDILATYSMEVPFKGLEISNITAWTMSGDDCVLTVVTNNPVETYSGTGAISYLNNRMVYGMITYNSSSTYTFTTPVKDTNECESNYMGYDTGNMTALFKSNGTKDAVTVAGLKTANFDIVDPDNSSTDADRVYSIYLSFLQGLGPSSTPPIWEMDEGEPRLFRMDK